jgi:hypothetical protein
MDQLYLLNILFSVAVVLVEIGTPVAVVLVD